MNANVNSYGPASNTSAPNGLKTLDSLVSEAPPRVRSNSNSERGGNKSVRSNSPERSGIPNSTIDKMQKMNKQMAEQQIDAGSYTNPSSGRGAVGGNRSNSSERSGNPNSTIDKMQKLNEQMAEQQIDIGGFIAR